MSNGHGSGAFNGLGFSFCLRGKLLRLLRLESNWTQALILGQSWVLTCGLVSDNMAFDRRMSARQQQFATNLQSGALHFIWNALTLTIVCSSQILCLRQKCKQCIFRFETKAMRHAWLSFCFKHFWKVFELIAVCRGGKDDNNACPNLQPPLSKY